MIKRKTPSKAILRLYTRKYGNVMCGIYHVKSRALDRIKRRNLQPAFIEAMRLIDDIIKNEPR